MAPSRGGRATAVGILATLVVFAILPAAAQQPRALEVMAADAALPLDLAYGDTTVVMGVQRVEVSWASPAGGRVPAYLWLPGGAGPHPALILQHGMPGSRDTFGGLAREYAMAGAVVLVPGASFARPDPPYRETTFFTLPLYDPRDGDEVIQTVMDLRRGVDLLRGRADVDPDRIAVIGASWGGWVGALLAGVEDRVLAYGLLVAPTSLAARLRGSDAFGRMTGWDERSPEQQAAWYRLMDQLDGRTFVARSRADHLRFDIGLRDNLVPLADARALAEAAPDGAVIVEWEYGHYLAPEVYRAQAEWLAPLLAIDVTGFEGPDFRR
ncbi:MAG: acetylxylan esterase [Gemmatimonadales bacterium]|nr:acetylxylan esterase [Gemmatimonadales bacterium]